MVSAERIHVTLVGGAPWGFRLSGGGALPLTINKLRKKSAAQVSGLKEGDAVISINGIAVHDKSQDEALELVEKSGETLNLEIFRGDVDELSRAKPKKTIQIGGGMEGGLVLTATVGDVSSASDVTAPQVQEDASSEIILTASVGDVTAESFDTPESEMGGSHGFTATLGDMSESSFDASPSGFTVTASSDDITSSSIMVDSITAEIGDLDNTGVILVPEQELQALSSFSPSQAQPYTDSKVIAVSPSHLSPQPPRASLSPQPPRASLSPKPLSFSPKPKAPSPKSPISSPSPKSPIVAPKPKSPIVAPKPKSPIPSPKSPSFTATSPKPVSFSPKPGAALPLVQNTSPKPFQPAPPPKSPQPSTVSSTTTTHEVFDDGQGQVRREVVVTAQKETTVSNQPSLVQHKSSAFETPSQRKTTTTTIKSTSVTKATNNNVTNRKGPVPFSTSSIQLDTNANISPALPSSQSTGKIQPPLPAPMFKPAKFVISPGKKEVPGLYGPGSPKVDVTVNAMFKDGKENVQPMFQVKNIVADKTKRGRDVWKPNVWLPGQQKPQQQPQQTHVSVTEDFSPYTTFPVPQLQSGVSLLEPRNLGGDSGQQHYEMEGYDEYDEVDAQGRVIRPSKLHIFAPPIEIHAPEDSGYLDSPYSPFLPYREDGEIDIVYHQEEGLSSPDSSDIRRKKNIYSDSAFYDTPGKSYPTIPEQMKLCKIIAHSLTSQANRRARGAKMFMKRRRKSNKWVHDGHSEWSSSAGDVANIHDLDSELSIDEGGTKPLFYFKIPNLKNRISSADRKMALTQEQFERLRLQSNKCDHKVVPPTTCFDIVADLKASKGKGGRMFEKRKVRVEKYVVDEKNARHAPRRARLEHALAQPVRQEKTPWEAAIQHGGNVDAAFSHIDEMERNQKLNQILKYPQPKKVSVMPVPKKSPVEPVCKTSLKSDHASMLRGKDFNRKARGWNGGGEYPVAEQLMTVPSPSKKSMSPTKPAAPTGSPTQQFGNYNTKIKAWQSPGQSPYVTSTSSKQRTPQSAPSPRRQDPWGQHSWHADVQKPVEQSERWRSQDDLQTRPKSWVPDNYGANTYKDEIDYTYVPVDYKFADDYQSPAYRQPIIPGTDL